MKTIRIITIILLLAVASNAVLAGYLLITDPSGSRLGLPLGLLAHSPFSSFLIPGIILLVVNGMMNFMAAFFTLLKWKNYPGWIVLQGILLCGWILVQILLIREINMLHLALGSIGILLFIFGNRLNV